MAHDILTLKQENFAQNVAAGEFQTEAYRIVYSTKNMATKTIWEEASRLMANPKVAARVVEIRAEMAKRNQVTLDKVLEQLSNWLLFDPLSIVDPETDCVKRLADMDERARLSLSEIHVQEIFGNVEDIDGNKKREKIGELKKIKFIDKRAVSDQFMKKFGAYMTDKNSLTDDLGAIKEIIDSIKR